MTKDVNLNERLSHYFGFDKFKGQQEAVIRNLMQGRDTFVLMPTGGGKSLCYQLPSLIMEGTAIVVSPLIALMKNQVDVITNLSDEEGVAHYLNSSLNKSQIDRVKNDIQAGRTKLLYVAPESLTKDENIDFLRSVKISFYAIDEAHCISEWGHDFRPEYRNIRPTIEKIGRSPIIALTATATDKVRQDIMKSLGIVDADQFKSSFNRPNLYYEVRPKTKEIDKDIIRFVKQHPGKSGIIYCLSRKKVEELAQVLKANDIMAAPYHAGLETAVRSQTQDDFLMERIDVIVATIAFGMGIDKPDVRFVIHYDIPKSLEGYYQETGRAGRDGGEGVCLAFYAQKDLQKLEKFMEGKPVAEQDIGRQLLAETASYAESSVCRRKMLLHYFGEEFDEKNCCNCDNCSHPKKSQEAKDQLVIVLNAIMKLKENFRSDYIIDFVIGKETNDIMAHKHDELEEFGCGADEDPKIWNPVIRQAIIAGYIKKDVESYGLLKIRSAGKKYLKKPTSFMIVLDNEFEDYEDESEMGGVASPLDPVLYNMLRDLRKKVAHELNQPPYTIFQDVSLDQMATDYPVSLTDLKTIQGVGDGKVKKPYCQRFVDLIKRYCDENDILRQADMRIRTVPKNSVMKLSIIQNIDRKISLDDIAKSKNIDISELIEKLESIVYSGTKLNIDYYLEEEMDEESIDEIYDYFLESDNDSVKVALEEFGDDGDDTEGLTLEQMIRLVRIKFISEMAN